MFVKFCIITNTLKMYNYYKVKFFLVLFSFNKVKANTTFKYAFSFFPGSLPYYIQNLGEENIINHFPFFLSLFLCSPFWTQAQVFNKALAGIR